MSLCVCVCVCVGVRALQFAAKINYIEKSKKDRNFVLSGKVLIVQFYNFDRS